MTRLLVMWQRPHVLSAEEAEKWVRRETGRAMSGDGVSGGFLARLVPPGTNHTLEYEWLLEIAVEDRAQAERILRGPRLRELLADLACLGMRPSVMVAES